MGCSCAIADELAVSVLTLMSEVDSLVRACYTNELATVRELVGRVDINGRGRDGEPPLYQAMRYGNHQVVEILLARTELELAMTDTLYQWTGLHAACYRGNALCVQLFLASQQCTKHMVRLEDRNGKTAEMLARQARNHECARLVSDYLATPDTGKSTVKVHPHRIHLEPGTLTVLQLSEAIEKIKEDELTLKEETSACIARLEEELRQYKVEAASDLAHLQSRKEALQAELQHRIEATKSSGDIPSAPPLSLIPECPVCFEEMKPPLQIYNCNNGHLICSVCMPQITGNLCTSKCGAVYTGRATAMEQMVRLILGIM